MARVAGGTAAAMVFKSDAAHALFELFSKNVPDMPSVENGEEFRRWFFGKAETFKEALALPEVQRVLNQPIDENLDLDALDEVMLLLLSQWPCASGAFLKHLPEYDPTTEDGWKNFPAVQLAVPLTSGGWAYGSGAHVMVEGIPCILTAEHVVDGSSIQRAALEEPRDIALVPRTELQTSSRAPFLPYKHIDNLWDAAGALICVSGIDDDGPYIDHSSSAKRYISTLLPETSALQAWSMFYGDHGNEETNRYFAKKRLNWNSPEKRKRILEINLKPLVLEKSHTFVILLPPGEVRRSDGPNFAKGMSGGPVQLAEESPDDPIIAVMKSVSAIHIGGACFSIGYCDANIKGVEQKFLETMAD